MLGIQSVSDTVSTNVVNFSDEALSDIDDPVARGASTVADLKLRTAELLAHCKVSLNNADFCSAGAFTGEMSLQERTNFLVAQSMGAQFVGHDDRHLMAA